MSIHKSTMNKRHVNPLTLLFLCMISCSSFSYCVYLSLSSSSQSEICSITDGICCKNNDMFHFIALNLIVYWLFMCYACFIDNLVFVCCCSVACGRFFGCFQFGTFYCRFCEIFGSIEKVQKKKQFFFKLNIFLVKIGCFRLARKIEIRITVLFAIFNDLLTVVNTYDDFSIQR